MISNLKNGNRIGIRTVINLTQNFAKPFASRSTSTPKKFYKTRFAKIIALGLTATAIAAYYRSANTSCEQPELRPLKAFPNDASLREKFNFIGSVVGKCAPAVVYIEIQDPRRIDPETNEPIIVSNGSGFLINSEGWILTNAHVVINKPKAIITIKLNDGTKYTARIEDADMNIDLALIKIDSIRKLPSLKFGKSGDVSIGEWVIALGSPLSLSHSVTAGIISSASRAADELGLRNHSMKYIQTDASITFGNSGGPLVNLDGDVIGINNLRITAGISFAIPIDYAKKFLDKGKYRGSKDDSSSEIVHTKQLGMTTLTLTEVILKELRDLQHTPSGDIKNGVLVWKVISNSPAQKSGLEAGDIITHINGFSIIETVDIYKKKQEVNVGPKITATLRASTASRTLAKDRDVITGPPASVRAMTDDYPHVPRSKGRSASICATSSTSMEAIPPTGGTPESGTPVSRRRRPAARSQSARISGGRSIRRRAAVAAAAANNTDVKSHCNSEPKLDQSDPTPEVSPNIKRKGSARRGTSVYHRKSAAFLDVPESRSNYGTNEEDEDSYRLRSFSFTSKGIVNRGDSFRRRRSRSNSLCPPSMGGVTTPSPVYDAPNETHPEIISYVVALLGAQGVGKTALVSQFMTSECINAYDRQKDSLGNQSVSIMLNGEESELNFQNISNPKEIDKRNPPDAFVVLYSVVDKASFLKAEAELTRLQDADLLRSRAAILVANKVDLARSRAVSAQDGKCLACTFRAKFIEISVGINHNVDELLVGILTQIRLKSFHQDDRDHSQQQWYKSRGVVRASMKARQMFTWLFGKEDSKFKNCENLHIL